MITTRIEYQADTRDYDIFVTIDGFEEYAGSASTRALAESFARSLRHDFYAK